MNPAIKGPVETTNGDKMKKNIKHAALCSVIGLLACTPALGEESGSRDLSNTMPTFHDGYMLTGEELVLASAGETSGDVGQAAAADSGDRQPT